MSLEDYTKKRDFKNTPEPEGQLDDNDKGRFVIQRHQARRLHYDLRLEMEGVLKSWAIPKGPSMNPKDKRLAIATEDHPVKYLHFEGTIPKGNYGAGEMQIWDAGTYTTSDTSASLSEQWKRGDLKLEFHGKKIRGNFALVHSAREDHENHWLLIKKKDTYATDLDYDAETFANRSKEPKLSKLRSFDPKAPVKPMLAVNANKIFNDPEWIYELKWDGYRVIAHVKNGRAELYSRNGLSLNSKFSLLVRELEKLPYEVILDGEVVILDKNGLPQFQKLQNYDGASPGDLRYYVFDMLYLNGHSMLDLPLLDRKSLIPEVLEDLENVFYCDHIEGMGAAFYKRAVDEGMEGVIAKKANSTYTPGYRSENWLKIKAVQSQEAIICGYTNSEKGDSLFGSLILGMFKDGELVYIGNCGTGFSNEEQKALLEKLKKLAQEENPFGKKISLKGRKPNWVEPRLICEIKFSEWTKNGSLRHPVYKGLRQDKEVKEIHKEIETKAPSTAGSSKQSYLDIGGIPVPISNPEKVYWPDSGFRKYELLDYYIKVGEVMLPYLKDRPQNLHRHPNGIQQKGFYQKDNEKLPDWVETFSIYSKSAGKEIEYLLCQNEATLLYMANLGCIEINPWNSRVQDLERPTYTVIDLDPSAKNSFEEVIEVAQATKEILDLAGIKGFCKTSGSRGLHIYIPTGEKYSYEEARDFTKLLCYYIHEKLPKLTSMDRALNKRIDKIYLDYLQNRKGQTLASPYCVRPRKGAPVSAPLEWKEIRKGLRILDFNIETMPARLEKKKDLFQGVLGSPVNIEKALEKLDKL